MATISSPGIGSGIDVSSIVSQLVALDRAPLTQLQAAAKTTQTKLSTYGTITSQFSALSDAASKLGSATGWNAVNATSSNAAAIGVTVSAGTAATSVTMEVSQLAKAQSAASTAVPTGTGTGAGSMTIELGAWTGSSFTAGSASPVSITINAGEDSLTEIAAKINDAGAGVTATVLRDASGERLLVRSKDTGAENGFKISVADNDGNLSNEALITLLFDPRPPVAEDDRVERGDFIELHHGSPLFLCLCPVHQTRSREGRRWCAWPYSRRSWRGRW